MCHSWCQNSNRSDSTGPRSLSLLSQLFSPDMPCFGNSPLQRFRLKQNTHTLTPQHKNDPSCTPCLCHSLIDTPEAYAEYSSHKVVVPVCWLACHFTYIIMQTEFSNTYVIIKFTTNQF